MPRPIFYSVEKQIEQFVRVDHAGEFGAQRIYQGQLKYTKDPEVRKLIYKMMQQETIHLNYFEKQIRQRKVRPTALFPFWNIGGYLLGSASALFGIKTAMLTTQAVEEVIEEHYQNQIDYLTDKLKIAENQELLDNIRQFQADEAEHKHIAIESGSKQAVFARSWSKFIKKICMGAIYLSEKI